MKRTTISMLITSLILFCTGLLLTVGTLIYTTAAGVDIYPGQSNDNANIRDFTKTFEDLGFDGTEAIKKINVNSLVGSVEIASTDQDSRIVFKGTDLNNTECKFEQNTITVRDINPVGFAGFEISEKGFSFNGLRQLFKGSSGASNSRVITVYINPNDFKGIINVSSVYGHVKAEGISCSECYIECSAGNVSVTKSIFNSILNIQGSTGNVYLRENSYLQSTVNVTVGNVYALVEDQKTNLQTTVGSIFILTELDKTQYQVRLSNTMGKIRPFDMDNSKNEVSIYSEGSNSIWAKTLIGDITVNQFDKEKYPQNDYSFNGDLIIFAE
ncbi:MAG: hypothetical protein E7646_07025 [Ruminococcaceae bacterium]|nr:hypothetical protein [Oscillospiraceae bacterium]